MRIEVFRSSKDSNYRFRAIANNGRILATSRGYRSRQGAVNGAFTLRRGVKTEWCDVIELKGKRKIDLILLDFKNNSAGNRRSEC